MKIVFIISSITDSHIIRRVQSFIDKGYEVLVYGFARGVSSANKFSEVPLEILGHVKDQKYFGRIYKEYKSVSSVLKRFPRNTLFYVWGYELALICMLRGRRFIYEISDMRYPQLRTPFKQILGRLDKIIIKNSEGTIITSEGFSRYLDIDLRDLILMPNKLTDSFTNIKRPDTLNKKEIIRFGFIGYYRYPETVLRLARVIGQSFPNYEFHFWGTGPEPILSQVRELANTYDNIYEHGSFKNPDDLFVVYDSIDIVACNYDSDGANERIAEPNKLYESIFFNKPILVSEGTFLGWKVDQMGVGYVIESHSDESVVKFLSHLSIDDVIKKSTVESWIPKTDLIEDYSNLWQLIEIKNQ